MSETSAAEADDVSLFLIPSAGAGFETPGNSIVRVSCSFCGAYRGCHPISTLAEGLSYIFMFFS